MSGPLLPASVESLRAVLNRDLTVSAAGEDVLLSEGRIVSEDNEPWEPAPRPFPAGNFDPRTAIFRAREAYREKVRANAMAVRQATDAVANALDNVRDDQGSVVSTGQLHGSDPSAGVAPQLATESGSHLEEGLSPASFAETPTDRLHSFDRQSVIEDVAAAEGDRRHTREALPPFALDSSEVCGPEAARAADVPVTGTPEAPQQSLVPVELPAWFRNDLPRVCQTCRDFRPGADGQRGWCSNAWAFTHRQLVQEHDVTPCHSAIGDWWAPVDDVWIVAADVSAHGRPTPILDRMTGDESGQRRRS